MGVSTLSSSDLWISLSGFIFFYTILAVIEVYLMIKYIRLGPDQLFQPADLSIHARKKAKNSGTAEIIKK